MISNKRRESAKRIRQAAKKLFFTQGYDATTLRQIAFEAGFKVGSLYNHIDSKEDLLLQIMGSVIDDLNERVREAVAAAEGDTIERLRAGLAAHLAFHAERAQEVFIGNTELKSLSEEARSSITQKRLEYESYLGDLIETADAAGLADTIDTKLHVYSFIAQATHIASWYRPDGRLSLEEIVEIYTRFALREIGVFSDN
ncbi:TetR/AcrR family transcriptional regulator [Salinisphaera sp. Q1T1-3]|uniref:TetR/AcrR family transcriptional regulator n=1 Tax=Salinisphaera sp. Q1T1-3 TaxID=2321229 RepID=UPI000E7290EE|nr:TetR/AcrR family transcriptional regulator [Salinisphaera sp. Q1T1-3]RJS92923.1 TetR/AcrR family transcriptional regulator [Salinisphaera sp. Q1T1-3]